MIDPYAKITQEVETTEEKNTREIIASVVEHKNAHLILKAIINRLITDEFNSLGLASNITLVKTINETFEFHPDVKLMSELDIQYI